MNKMEMLEKLQQDYSKNGSHVELGDDVTIYFEDGDIYESGQFGDVKITSIFKNYPNNGWSIIYDEDLDVEINLIIEDSPLEEPETDEDMSVKADHFCPVDECPMVTQPEIDEEAESNFVKHARKELDLLLSDNEEMDSLMKEQILEIIELISSHGHSGTSIHWMKDILCKLITYENLTPLTGEKTEWNEITDSDNDNILYQNKRMSNIFKTVDKFTGEVKVKQNDKIIFIDPIKGSFTNSNSSIPVTFPYTSPENEYRFIDYNGSEVAADKDGNHPYSIEKDLQSVLDEYSGGDEIDLSTINNIACNQKFFWKFFQEEINDLKSRNHDIKDRGYSTLSKIFNDREFAIELYISNYSQKVIGFKMVIFEDGECHEENYWQNYNYNLDQED